MIIGIHLLLLTIRPFKKPQVRATAAPAATAVPGPVSYTHLLNEMNISELLDYIKKLRENNLDIYECLDLMQLWYRDVLMFKTTKDINLLIFKNEYGTINEMSQKSSYEGLNDIMKAVDKARVRLDANVNMELALELMLLVMKEN